MDNFDFKKYLAENRIHADHDLINEKKEDSKKGNKEEQKRMEGAIRDNEIHIDKLNKDKKADKKKLAKLKADEPKDVSEAQGYNDRDDEAIGAKDGAEKDKKVSMKGRRDMSRGMEKSMGKRADSTDSKMDEDMDELPKSIAAKEQAQIERDAKKGLTKEGLKDMIREKITSILNEENMDEGDNYYEDSMDEAEEIEVKDNEEVDVDIEKEVDIDDESSKSEIEVDSELAGESSDISAILGLLTKAQDEAKSLGDEKLMDQIGNTITFFTRKHVVQSAD